MRRRLIDLCLRAFRDWSSSRRSPRGAARRRPGGSTPGEPPPSTRRRPRRSDGGTAAPRSPSGGGAPALDIDLPSADEARFEYSPNLDGDPDPGEVVWTWVPFEEDPTQGKDRPVLIVGRHGSMLLGVALTSKRHDRDPQVEVGSGGWDSAGRVSYAKLDRVLDVDPAGVRREGDVLARHRFDAVIDGLRGLQRGR
jgi:hypothetical protein